MIAVPFTKLEMNFKHALSEEKIAYVFFFCAHTQFFNVLAISFHTLVQSTNLPQHLVLLRG